MQSSQEHPLPPEIANFKPTFQKSLATKKIFFQGRRIAPIQLFPSRNRTAEDVKVYLFEDFLSPEECDGLRAVHDSHIQMANEVPPLLCFESLDTLRKHLSYAKKSDIKVTRDVFTKGTYCLNSTFSTRVADFLHYNWSYSTAFYPNESVFSNMVAALIQETTGLRKENGGKFQITSYPLHIGYKKHTDCTEGTGELRDRMATILVYLDDVEVGGETEFTELGIKVRPKKGQALVWNNMNPKGECIPASVHEASKVTKGKKYILQRWYYHKSFWSLGRRPEPPSLPERTAEQALVLCDEYKHGSCRWYDEWLPDVMEDYRRRSATLI
ncbi:uncharacterized protein [Watersipora subatra]|uniref:uncharacterized protein n=1 Tax=Watersipora subatra TaxID=2589382 RepID=UPI00355BB51F